MKGTILGISLEENTGYINSLDGKRYKFKCDQWLSEIAPKQGMCVDFLSHEVGTAVEVFADIKSDERYMIIDEHRQQSGLYRISSRAVWGGVCAGLAHKAKVSKEALRVVTVFVTIVFFPLFFIYCILWMLLPAIEEGGDRS